MGVGTGTYLEATGNLSEVSAPATALSNLGALGNAVSTGLGGFVLQNATPVVLSWTAPADGQMHRVMVPSELVVTSTQTGGAIQVSFFDPGNVQRFRTQFAGGLAASQNFANPMFLVQPGSTVNLIQSSAQSAGAATLWAEIWAV